MEIKPGDMDSGFAQPAAARGGSASRAGDLALHVTDVPAGESALRPVIGLNGRSARDLSSFQGHVNEPELRRAGRAWATRSSSTTSPQKRLD